jgi:3-hydroxyisobutyrate dehydrogenase
VRLLEGGHRLWVWNRSPGRAADLVAAGAQEATSVAQAVAGADVVVTMLANDEAVRSVALGKLRTAIGPAAVYVDSSTVSSELSGELAATFPRFVALPVIGAPPAVRSGTAVFLAGGGGALVDSLAPVLSSLGTVRRYATASLALTAKLTNNLLLLLSEVAALAETFAVGRAGGLSNADLRDLLEDSPLLSPGLKNRFVGILTREQEAWWSLVLGAKDVGLALDVARGADVTLPIAEVVHELYDRVAANGDADADITAVSTLYGTRHPAASGTHH